MKKWYSKIIVFFIAVLFFGGCNSSVNNSFKITNSAGAGVIVTFRAQAISVPSGQTTVIKEIPQGTFSYSTVFSIPAGAKTSTSSGDVSGKLNIKAGTRILLLYSSTLKDSTYSLYATLSVSDDETTTTGP